MPKNCVVKKRHKKHANTKFQTIIVTKYNLVSTEPSFDGSSARVFFRSLS